MGCCGQGRAALRTSRRQIAAYEARASAVPAPPPAPGGQMRLEYPGASSLNLLGAVSGTAYAFDPQTRVLPVDPADVPELLRSGLLRLA
jgi:hypothetical protein